MGVERATELTEDRRDCRVGGGNGLGAITIFFTGHTQYVVLLLDSRIGCSSGCNNSKVAVDGTKRVKKLLAAYNRSTECVPL